MQHVEVVILIDKGLGVEAVIVLGTGEVLGEDDAVGEALLGVVAGVPVVLTLVCHYLLYPLPVHSLQILIMQIVIQSLQRPLILLLPLTDMFL